MAKKKKKAKAGRTKKGRFTKGSGAAAAAGRKGRRIKVGTHRACR